MSVGFRLLVCVLLVWHGWAAAASTVRFPRPEFEGDHRSDYARQLLELALAKSGSTYQIELSASPMSQERQVRELEAGRTVDVAPIPSNPQREARLLPIRIPINKGVLGWRLGLIRKGSQSQFKDVDGLEDLSRLRLAQGQDWPDTQILEANGIKVIRAQSYEGLFKMLAANRFDYFPRSIVEIWDEQANNADTLEVESRVALHYFYDAYFMVNRRNTKLAQDIRNGLERAVADGSFDKLFQQYHGERLRKARLETRTIIELKNPLLTPDTPSDRPELWYDFRRTPARTK